MDGERDGAKMWHRTRRRKIDEIFSLHWLGPAYKVKSYVPEEKKMEKEKKRWEKETFKPTRVFATVDKGWVVTLVYQQMTFDSFLPFGSNVTKVFVGTTIIYNNLSVKMFTFCPTNLFLGQFQKKNYFSRRLSSSSSSCVLGSGF